MGKSSAPTPPDPQETAAAQTGTNVSTAIANNMMGMVDQYTPQGNLTYDQTGTYSMTDPYTGQTYEIPRYSSNLALNDTQQATLDQSQSAEQNLATLANNQSGFLADYMSQPADFDTSEIEGRLYDLGSQRLDPRFEREQESLRTRLSQQGITPGSEAYNREMESLGQSKNDAYNQLMLSGRGQAMSELMAQRNQPINEITALLSGSQVSNPAVSMYTPQGMATTDVAGMIGDNYNAQMNAWSQNQASAGGLFGNLIGAAGKIGAATMMSDVRTKSDITPIGKRAGLTVYEYRYNWDEPGAKRRGYLAQEVAQVRPDAVVQMGNRIGLDYDKLPEVA